MTTAPIVDVVVPHYGDTALLAQAITSVLQQTDESWRLVVVDDSASAEVATLVRDLASPKVEYHSNTQRLGVAGNFQRCLDLVRAEWVVFLGCDDRLLPGYVAHLQSCAERHSHVSAVMPAVQVIGRDGRDLATMADLTKRLLRTFSGPGEVRAGERLLTSLMHGNWTYFPATAWRSSAIRPHGFRQDLPTTLDLALLADLVLVGHQIAVTSHTNFQYRRHAQSASSLTASSTERFGEEARLLHELAIRSRERGWPRAARAARLHVTSRLHSALLVPSALKEDRPHSARALVRHTFGAVRA
ncbi:glycosyltransferase family A protein [Nocardioides sp.]|uniref:glycosyltransferase family A protein n=1 Tax=Nocardioides sp. TaxID=35761 RepID=UPI00286B6BF9|nr:glycosyltransferase family A protein [Nocardioides sp.]